VLIVNGLQAPYSGLTDWTLKCYTLYYCEVGVSLGWLQAMLSSVIIAKLLYKTL